MSSALKGALETAGFPPDTMVMHGWRSAFSTIMNERDPTNARVIEVMIAHKIKDGLEARYNRAEYREACKRIACQWADLLLDGAPSPLALIGLDEVEATNVVEFRRSA